MGLMEALGDTRSEVQEAIQTILGVFNAEDGGARFVMLLAFIRDFDKRARSGDIAAEELMQIVIRFARLLDRVTK